MDVACASCGHVIPLSMGGEWSAVRQGLRVDSHSHSANQALYLRRWHNRNPLGSP